MIKNQTADLEDVTKEKIFLGNLFETVEKKRKM